MQHSAHAQSSGTLYGPLDEGISYIHSTNTPAGGRSNVKLTDAMMQSNRWGLRGSEDLGGGLKAVFVLESGFTLSNGKLGQGGREFGRNAYVGLSSNQLGTVTLGRQNEFMHDWVGHMSMENINGAGGNIFAHVMDNDNMMGTFRTNNAVKYTSPNYYGLTVGGMYAFSNQAGGFANNRLYSLSAQYNNGPIAAALGYTQINNSATTLNPTGAVDNFANGNGNGNGTGDQNFTAGRQQTFGGGLHYTFGQANVGFVITNTRLDHATAFGAFGNTGAPSLSAANAAYARFTNYEVNAHYNVTSAWTLGAAYIFTDAKFSNAQNSASPKWGQVGLLSDYNLSKCTDLYAAANWSHLSGGLTAAGPALTEFEGASSYIGGTATAKNQVVVGGGIRTRF